MNFFKFDRNRLIGFGICIFIFLLTALFYARTKILDGFERGAYDQRFVIRAPDEYSKKIEDAYKHTKRNPRANPDIIIIGIDENTIRAFSQQGYQWPFRWDVHSTFTKFVGSGNPAAIFFDIMFVDPRKKEEKKFEKVFARAIEQAGTVYLDYPFEVTEQDKQYDDIAERIKYLSRLRFPKNSDDYSRQWVAEALPPLPILAGAAKGIGYANVRPDDDHVNRKMPLVLKFGNYYYPNIDLVILMDYYGITKNDVEIKMGDYIKLKNVPLTKMKKPNPGRSITIPIDDDGFMDINFIGGPGSFSHVPYHYFHREGTMGSNRSLQGKICLVGAYSVAGIATDVHKSPYGDTFGIEHHASALNTIINQDFIHKLSETQNILILLVIAIVFGFLLTRISTILSIVLTVFAVAGYSIVAYMLFESHNLIFVFASPIIQMGVSFSFVTAYRVFTEQREKKYIRQTFSKFVSKSVVDELLKHPDNIKLGGEKKILTVLFSDIRGFTSISEQMTPEELVEHLNVYLQAMTDVVIKYNGTLDKYVGDEIMAFWGAPLPQDNHAHLASMAAIDMMIELRKLNEKWKIEKKPTLDIGIGLNTGDMVVGNMGSASRMDYTLMGDMVNLGARLEGTNKVYGTNIIISEFTYEHVRDVVIARELDLIRVKGKEKPVKIYELMDVTEKAENPGAPLK